MIPSLIFPVGGPVHLIQQAGMYLYGRFTPGVAPEFEHFGRMDGPNEIGPGGHEVYWLYDKGELIGRVCCWANGNVRKEVWNPKKGYFDPDKFFFDDKVFDDRDKA